MLSERSSVDIHALHRQGFTISEIARRTHHDRKTIRARLTDVDAADPGPRAAASLRRVFTCHGASERDHRAPAR